MKKKVKYKFFVSEDVKRCDDITPAQLNELCKSFPEFSNEESSVFSCEHSYDFDDPRFILLEDFIESNIKKLLSVIGIIVLINIVKSQWGIIFLSL